VRPGNNGYNCPKKGLLCNALTHVCGNKRHPRSPILHYPLTARPSDLSTSVTLFSPTFGPSRCSPGRDRVREHRCNGSDAVSFRHGRFKARVRHEIIPGSSSVSSSVSSPVWTSVEDFNLQSYCTSNLHNLQSYCTSLSWSW
jgi:hypothetical protein